MDVWHDVHGLVRRSDALHHVQNERRRPRPTREVSAEKTNHQKRISGGLIDLKNPQFLYSLLICLQSLRMLERFRRMQPKKKLRIYTISLIALAVWLLLMTISSLSIIASNLMVNDELSTSTQRTNFEQAHPTYLNSQKMIIASDVLCMVFLPLLIFSVFKFYTKGNLIIIGVNSVFQGMRWISAVVFLAADQQFKKNWGNLLAAAEYGDSPMCDSESCGENMLNYVICGKLQLWREALDFEFGFVIIGIPLVAAVMFLAYQTNQLDLKLVQFSESTD